MYTSEIFLKKHKASQVLNDVKQNTLLESIQVNIFYFKQINK